jgi:hypothetical protein
MADDDALNRAKRALVPRAAGNDALSRAKRALAPADNSGKLDGLLERARAAARSDPLPAVVGKDTGRIDDLLTRARTLAKPVEVKPTPAPEPVPVRDGPSITPSPLREAPRNPPLAPIAAEPAAVVPMPARRPAEVLPAEAPVQHVTVQQTVIVQAPPVYPYPYPYWPLWAGCTRWNCPLRAGLPCNRSWLTCGRW